MTRFDRITEGEREKALLEKLRAGVVTADNVEEHCLPFFLKVQIQTDSRCNARCATCPYPVTSRSLPQGKMEEETFFKIVDQLKGRGVERVSLFLMNEPLVDRRIERFCKHLKAEDPNVCALIFTNGQLLSAQRALALSKAGMDEIDVSINGFDAESHASMMKGVDFNRVMKNLHDVGALVRSGQLEGTRVKVVGLNPPCTDAQAERLKAETGIDVYVKPVTNRAGLIDTKRFGSGPGLSNRMTLCQRPFVKAYILYSGEMVLCNCDWTRSTIIGHVNEATLEELWLSPALMDVRRAHLAGALDEGLPCAECDYPYLI
jgi:hypothetical protein